MKVVKPMRLSIMHRPFENNREHHLAVTVHVFFPFGDPSCALPEINMWKLLVEELGEEGTFDECMPKPSAELLVNARAYPRGGKPAAACAVRVQLGPDDAKLIDKKLYVAGNRYWKGSSPSDPATFEEMPITYTNAFGGEGFAHNPKGKGFVELETEKGTLRPLPNVEDPRHPVASPRDKPMPAGFAAYELPWPQRFSKMGTYDQKWMKERFPGFAEDFQWSFFNVAPEDQRLKGFLQGGESFVLENMHRDKPKVEGRAPTSKPRCFVTRQQGDEQSFDEVSLRAETLHLFPHVERGILTFRGVAPLREDDAAEILHIIAGLEGADERKPKSHYQEVLTQRLDKELGAVLALNDKPLMPADFRADPSLDDNAISDMDELAAVESLLAKNIHNRAQKELNDAREVLKAEGYNPDDYGSAQVAPMQPPPSLDELPELIISQKKEADEAAKAALTQRDEAEAEARKLCDEHGLDYDDIVSNARQEAAGPPKFTADAELEKIRDMAQLSANAGMPLPEIDAKLADPELEPKLRKAEKELRETYRQFAIYQPAAARLTGDAAAQLRAEVMAARQAGSSLADRDLTGADLAGMDLSGMDFERAFLESANLSDCQLNGTNFSYAVLARADLSRSSAQKAKFVHANLADAQLEECNLAGSDCSHGIFATAKLTRTKFDGAILHAADLSDAIFGETDMRNVQAKDMIIMQCDLSGTVFAGSTMNGCHFVECQLNDVDFSNATVDKSAYVSCEGNRITFKGSHLANFRVVHDSSFEKANFSGTVLKSSNFRGTKLRGANFDDADLESSDFSECDLQDSSFQRANAPNSMWIRTDLRNAKLLSLNAMMGILQKANVEGADFTGANLFRADFALIKGNDATKFDDANMKQIRFVDRGDHGKR